MDGIDAGDGIDDVADELRHLDVIEPRLYQPLQLDRMFMRATKWTTHSTSTIPENRPASPPRQPTIYPLPLPQPSSLNGTDRQVSPLAGLMDYPELLPHILKWFERPSELAVLSRVNRDFYHIVRKKLYERIWIRPWEAHSDQKIVDLFRVLSTREDLCRLVKTLEVRFFPLAARDTERYELDDQVTAAFRQMANLQHLVWTRDKSLNHDLVNTFISLHHLRSLEISGHSYRYYDPNVLGSLPQLEDLRIMMPDPTCRDALRGIIEQLAQRTVGGLKGLGIIARNSALVDDALLRDAAEHCRDLQRLTLWGCTKVTREGVFEIIKEAQYLEELSIDASSHSGLSDLSGSPSLSSLDSLSISFSPPHRLSPDGQLLSADLPILPPAPALSSLLLTLSSDRAIFPSDGLDILSQQVNFRNLTRLSILNLFCSASDVSTILALSPYLEELYLSIKGNYVISTSDLMSPTKGKELQILHLNAPERFAPTVDDLRELASNLDRLEQVGSGNRVYEVHKRLEEDERVVELCRWSRTYTPGYFQNWRG